MKGTSVVVKQTSMDMVLFSTSLLHYKNQRNIKGGQVRVRNVATKVRYSLTVVWRIMLYLYFAHKPRLMVRLEF